ncbi:unnamed protein product [Triticum turgidum subsp. durum]|uniref:Inositol polyphosphate-related phosphatase domain-containing protein n=1 Tax=Triticum turgidum subsp. durum TaxID=4567 RepID=A0A9R0SZ04_TRITD|nr:unnamed protein product [Triticum turgidum subsp. durum]
MNTTVDLRESPEHSPMASPSASSSSFFKSTSLKFSNYSSPVSTSTHIESFRVFAATWNVAGKTPDMELNLNDFLPSDDHSDVYVLGFQEVVPLNAGNVLVIEDNEPASRWLALINQALNRTSSSPPASRSFSQSASPASALHTASSSPLDPSQFHKNGSSPREVRRAAITRGRRLNHLASGEKDGDELRRNSDVVEILKNTQFRRVCKRSGRRIPERILDHDRVIWLGDLNYRIALSYAEAKKLVDTGDWAALFEKDQLKTEREGGVFRGWSEGVISFAPTYKYSWNSDSYYVGEDDDGAASKKKTKRRTPAWCDRILWRGDGIVQVAYVRGESKFSDHRPVCGAFIVEIAVLDGAAKMVKLVAATASMKVGAEELLLPRQP